MIRALLGQRPHSPCFRQAARWRGRTVALYGGSFNPGHDGHKHVALSALKRLPVDAVWLMVSPGNPLKADRDMAPFDARLESARLLADSHPSIHATDIEAQLGSRRTSETVMRLKAALPLTRFIWIMGADNMAGFHTWHRWEAITHALPIAIFDRPGYSARGNASRFAVRYRHQRTTPQKLRQPHGPAWAFLTIPRHRASATSIRARLGDAWTEAGDMTDASFL